jgi:hypothetical protein
LFRPVTFVGLLLPSLSLLRSFPRRENKKKIKNKRKKFRAEFDLTSTFLLLQPR